MAISTSKALVPVVIPVYNKILSLFPQNYFRFCFAYGSGVFKQGGVSVDKNPMIDLLFVVDDSEGFHGQNVNMNPEHYSCLKRCGHRVISFVQEKLPAKVYFNTLIPFRQEGVMFKYGVVKRIDLIDDLLDWQYLYLSGRLQKPVKFLMEPPADVQFALEQNLLSAIHAALIILPEIFTEREFYTVIANLSYRGDFRMFFGEDKNKVSNIVDKQIPAFRNLYQPLLQTIADYIQMPFRESPDELCFQDYSPVSRNYHLFQLPKAAQHQLVIYWKFHVDSRRNDIEEALRNLAYYTNLNEILSDALSRIVLKSSIEQSFKGIFTAGLLKSFKYSNQKIIKMYKSSGKN